MIIAGLALSILFGGSLVLPIAPAAEDAPEGRAVAFLGREVSRWSRENRCFSCHNDGDAARALFVSLKTPHAAKIDGVAPTIEFLSRPDRWEKNGVDAGFSDKRLARLQFASALAEADAAGQIADRSTLAKAAGLLANDQAEDGSWPIDDAAPVGSPATYGPPVATAIAVRTLRRADSKRFRAVIAKAETWLRGRPIRNVHDAFAILVVMTPESKADRDRIAEAIELLIRAQNDDGGWGPFPRSPSEPFDSALALIALAGFGDRGGVREARRRGRDFLVNAQDDDGGWPGTTRPAGGESYAQRISTSAWSVMALTATDPSGLKAASPRS